MMPQDWPLIHGPGIHGGRRCTHMTDHSHTAPPSDPALRIKALESLLVEKGLIDPAAVDEIIETYERRIGPRNGAKVVARAWTDPDYKARLMRNATAAIAELGFSGAQGEDMVVVENTPEVTGGETKRSGC